MIGNVILPSTQPEDWPAIRQSIRQRIMATMGVFPSAGKPEMRQIERYMRHDLLHVRFSYHVIADHWNEAVMVLPGAEPPTVATPTIMAVHGYVDEGKNYCLNPVGGANCAYPIDLARRGYVCVAPDQFGFGEGITAANRGEVVADFYKRWPDWSLDGMRLFEQQRLLDTLATLPYVDAARFGVIGNSLGGRATIYLTCLDERIVAGVSSTGISPNCTNVYRNYDASSALSPLLTKAIATDGRIPWEYNEMLSLAAPRALLVLEPCNDPYNPDVAPVMECAYRAWPVFELLGSTENLAMLVHGRGHDTPPDIREFAYVWFDRHLRGGDGTIAS